MQTVAPRTDEIEIPRLNFNRAFPRYSYVPGLNPHPIRDENGHSYGRDAEKCNLSSMQSILEDSHYLYAIDLFNYGYYWEAHESWEAVWHALGRSTPPARFVQGLIKLAASGVKVREGRSNGVERHAARSASLFRESQRCIQQARIGGFLVEDLVSCAEWVRDRHLQIADSNQEPTSILLPFVLMPQRP